MLFIQNVLNLILWDNSITSIYFYLYKQPEKHVEHAEEHLRHNLTTSVLWGWTACLCLYEPPSLHPISVCLDRNMKNSKYVKCPVLVQNSPESNHFLAEQPLKIILLKLEKWFTNEGDEDGHEISIVSLWQEKKHNVHIALTVWIAVFTAHQVNTF